MIESNKSRILETKKRQGHVGWEIYKKDRNGALSMLTVLQFPATRADQWIQSNLHCPSAG